MKANWKDCFEKIWRGWLFSVFVVVLLTTSFRSAVADWNVIPSGSMKPTILEGDRVFVNRLAYDLKFPFTRFHLADWSDPKRGDIVVFSSPRDGKRLVKRVIGIPGDTIELRGNRLIVNGRQMAYEQLSPDLFSDILPDERLRHFFFSEDLCGEDHPVMISRFGSPVASFGPVNVPEEHFFLLGDNRDNSGDSRFFGFVNRDRVLGRAVAVVISLNYEKHHLPRWDRSFTALP